MVFPDCMHLYVSAIAECEKQTSIIKIVVFIALSPIMLSA